MKLKKASIVLNIFNLFVMALLVIGICFCAFAVIVVIAMFGPTVANPVISKTFKISAGLIAPHIIIFIFTIVALACVICRKEAKLIKHPKTVNTFLVLYIVCLVVSGLCTLVPFIYIIWQLAKDSLNGVDGWDGFGIVILYVVLELFSITTSIISIKYLNYIQNKIELLRGE